MTLDCTSSKQEDVLSAIIGERSYQDQKWGPRVREVGTYLTLMRNHLTEAEAAFSNNAGDKLALDELRKVVALGVACFEQHGVPSRMREQPDMLTVVEQLKEFADEIQASFDLPDQPPNLSPFLTGNGSENYLQHDDGSRSHIVSGLTSNQVFAVHALAVKWAGLCVANYIKQNEPQQDPAVVKEQLTQDVEDWRSEAERLRAALREISEAKILDLGSSQVIADRALHPLKWAIKDDKEKAAMRELMRKAEQYDRVIKWLDDEGAATHEAKDGGSRELSLIQRIESKMPSGQSVDCDAYAEKAFWNFDARHKGLAAWKARPQSERDAFKAEIRIAIATAVMATQNVLKKVGPDDAPKNEMSFTIQQPNGGVVNIDGYTPWVGGTCPVDQNDLVDVILRNGRVLHNNVAGKLCWLNDDVFSESSHITGYKVTLQAPAPVSATTDDNVFCGDVPAPTMTDAGNDPLGLRLLKDVPTEVLIRAERFKHGALPAAFAKVEYNGKVTTFQADAIDLELSNRHVEAFKGKHLTSLPHPELSGMKSSELVRIRGNLMENGATNYRIYTIGTDGAEANSFLVSLAEIEAELNRR